MSRTFTIGGVTYPAKDVDLTKKAIRTADLIEKYSLNMAGPVAVEVEHISLWDEQRARRESSVNEFVQNIKESGFIKSHSITICEPGSKASKAAIAVDGNHRLEAVKRILNDKDVSEDVKAELRRLPCIVLSKETPIPVLIQIGIKMNSTNDIVTQTSLIMQAEVIKNVMKYEEAVKQYALDLTDSNKPDHIEPWYPVDENRKPKGPIPLTNRLSAYILNKEGIISTLSITAGNYQQMLATYSKLPELVILEQHQMFPTPVFTSSMFSRSLIRVVISMARDHREVQYNQDASLEAFKRLFVITEDLRKGSVSEWTRFFGLKEPSPNIETYISEKEKITLSKEQIDLICSPYLNAMVAHAWLSDPSIRNLNQITIVRQTSVDDVLASLCHFDSLPKWVFGAFVGKEGDAVNDLVLRHYRELYTNEQKTTKESKKTVSAVKKAAKEARKHIPPTPEERQVQGRMIEHPAPEIQHVVIPQQVEPVVVQQEVADEIMTGSVPPVQPKATIFDVSPIKSNEVNPIVVLNGVAADVVIHKIDIQLRERNICAVDIVVPDSSKDVPTVMSSFFNTIPPVSLIIASVPCGCHCNNTDIPLSSSDIDMYTKCYYSILSDFGHLILVAENNIDALYAWNKSLVENGFATTTEDLIMTPDALLEYQVPSDTKKEWNMYIPKKDLTCHVYVKKSSVGAVIPYCNFGVVEHVKHDMIKYNRVLEIQPKKYEVDNMNSINSPQLFYEGFLEYIILMYTKKNDIVVDSFGRGGLTSVVAALLGRQGVTFEHENKGLTTMQRNQITQQISISKITDRKKAIMDSLHNDDSSISMISKSLEMEESVNNVVKSFFSSILKVPERAGQLTDELENSIMEYNMTLFRVFGGEYIASVTDDDPSSTEPEIKRLISVYPSYNSIVELENHHFDPEFLLSVIDKLRKHESEKIPVFVVTKKSTTRKHEVSSNQDSRKKNVSKKAKKA